MGRGEMISSSSMPADLVVKEKALVVVDFEGPRRSAAAARRCSTGVSAVSRSCSSVSMARRRADWERWWRARSLAATAAAMRERVEGAARKSSTRVRAMLNLRARCAGEGA